MLFLDGDCPRAGTVPKAALLDISGRKVLYLKPGANDVSVLGPGVYFLRRNTDDGEVDTRPVTKVAVTR